MHRADCDIMDGDWGKRVFSSSNLRRNWQELFWTGEGRDGERFATLTMFDNKHFGHFFIYSPAQYLNTDCKAMVGSVGMLRA